MRARLSKSWALVGIAILGVGCQAQDGLPSEAPRDFHPCAFDALKPWGLFTPYDVGRDFSIKLSFRHTPLPDIQIVLNGHDKFADRTPIVALTDASGTAWFTAVKPGKYSAIPKGGLIFPRHEITVGRGTHSGEAIDIVWPLAPLSVQALRGQLLTPEKKSVRPLPLTIVKLVNLRSSEIIEETLTLEDGSYEFSTIRPGLYVVRVVRPTDDKRTSEDDVAVELDPAAKEPSIPQLKVVQLECYGVQLFQKKANGKWEDE